MKKAITIITFLFSLTYVISLITTIVILATGINITAKYTMAALGISSAYLLLFGLVNAIIIFSCPSETTSED